MKTIPLKLSKVIGHRGLAKFAPENTIDSIRKAHEHHLSWVEVDVMLSRDNIPVLLHDETLDRTTNAKGLLTDHDLQHLLSVDAGSWFHPDFKNASIPTLHEALTVCDKLNLSINLELKPSHHNEERLLLETLDCIHKLELHCPHILFSSFNKSLLKLCATTASNFPLAYLVDDKDNEASIIQFAKEISCYSVHLPIELVSPALIQQLHTLGKKVLVFTVNEQLQAEQLIAQGVDAVFSDYPLVL